jgi:hypothetical protein
VPLATTFWDTLFLFLILVPLAMLWAFALVDIFRRDDMEGGWKAIWVLCVILVPFFGTLVYLVFRKPGASFEKAANASREQDTTALLKTLADLHDKGKLTDEEFAAEKARVLGT